MKFHDLDDAYAKRPVITGIFVLTSHVGFTFLVPEITSAFPGHEVSIATILMWVWFAWMVISGVATFKYLKLLIERKK